MYAHPSASGPGMAHEETSLDEAGQNFIRKAISMLEGRGERRAGTGRGMAGIGRGKTRIGKGKDKNEEKQEKDNKRKNRKCVERRKMN